MEQLIKQQTMSSREIAELTGKEHKHVLRDCDVLNENYEKIPLPKIEQGYYTHPNTGNQQHREYLLTRMQCLDLLTGYKIELRIKVNRRWEELETKNTLDFSNPDTVLMLAQNWKEERQKRELAESKAALMESVADELHRTNEALKPKALFADAVATSDKTVLVAELAKIITQNGVEIGQNRLFGWMRQNGYLCSKGEYYNQPSQKAMDMGLFEIKKTTITKPDGVVLVSCTTKVTGKGQIYFVNKFLRREAA
jgi:phage antirepressor YoqD-like protein